MKKTSGYRIAGLLLAAAITFGGATAFAVIRSEVVVLLGTEIAAGRVLDEAKLRALELTLLTTPSMTWDGDTRPVRRFVGLQLGVLPLRREGDEAATWPVPGAAQIQQVRDALGKIGIADQPQLVLAVWHSGGK
jgi:hypothetical protein